MLVVTVSGSRLGASQQLLARFTNEDVFEGRLLSVNCLNRLVT